MGPKGENMTDQKLTISATKVANGLAIIALLLIVASSITVAGYYLSGGESAIARKLMKFFYVDLELNAPAFFSGLLLLFAALLLSLTFYMKRRRDERKIAPWAVLACGFLVMAFDEIVSVHERLIEPMREVLGGQDLGIFYFAWVVPAIVLVLGLGLYFSSFLLRLPTTTFFGFFVAGALFLGGAIGLELLEGRHSELFGKEDIVYITFTTCEEALEMLGVIVFIRSLLRYLSDQHPEVGISFLGHKKEITGIDRTATVGRTSTRALANVVTRSISSTN